jgi:ABC-2 type transport system permease protein
VAALAWVADQSSSSAVYSYLLVGAPLMAVWNSVIFRVGWSLSIELNGRTLEFALITRTPLIFILFGKSLAEITYGIPTGLAAFLAMVLVTRQLPPVANLPMLAISLLFLIVSMAVTGLLLAPTVLLVKGRGGFFNSIMSLGVLLSGFLFPIEQLPWALRAFAMVLPTSWAMTGVWQSVRSVEPYASVAGALSMCILMSLMIFGLTYLLFRAVEKRIRVTGALGTY